MTKRRILMLSYPFPPAMSGGVFRILRFAKYLPDFGWEPIVITPRPESVHPITVDDSLQRLVPEGLRVVRTRVYRPVVSMKSGLKRAVARLRSPGKPNPASKDASGKTRPAKEEVGTRSVSIGRLVRAMEGLLFATPDRHIGWLVPAVQAGLKIVRRERPQVIYSTGPPHSTHLIAIVIKRITGLPVVLDFRDPWVGREWTSAGKGSIKQRLNSAFEHGCVRAADRVVLNTAPVCRQFRSVYNSLPTKRFSVIPNGFDPELVPQVDELLRLNNTHNNGAIRLCHAGSAWGKRDIRPLGEAVKLIAAGGRHVCMDQVGAVDSRLTLPKHLCEGYPTGGVRCLGALPHEQALRRMANANVLVLLQPDNTLQIPGKLYEMLPFRKPILSLTGKGATSDIIQKYALGPVVDTLDPQAIAQGIIEAAGMNEQSVKQNTARAMQTFDGRTLTRRLANLLEEIE